MARPYLAGHFYTARKNFNSRYITVPQKRKARDQMLHSTMTLKQAKLLAAILLPILTIGALDTTRIQPGPIFEVLESTATYKKVRFEGNLAIMFRWEAGMNEAYWGPKGLRMMDVNKAEIINLEAAFKTYFDSIGVLTHQQMEENPDTTTREIHLISASDPRTPDMFKQFWKYEKPDGLIVVRGTYIRLTEENKIFRERILRHWTNHPVVAHDMGPDHYDVWYNPIADSILWVVVDE